MCRFKSGIILNKKIILAEGGDESHSALLKQLGMEDSYINASKTFVRAELIPKDEAWWIDPDAQPDKWKFVVDQDITPEWFALDKQKHEADFRKAVCEWWKAHVFVDKKIEMLDSGYYRLKRCEVKRLLKNAQVLLSSSMVQEMCDSSMVQEMYDSSMVQEMYDSSMVQDMWGSSTVQKMHDSSTVQKMWDSSTVQEMWGSSTVQEMHDSSTVQEMWGSSTVQKMWDSSTVQEMRDSSMARNFKNYPDIEVYRSKEGRFKMLIFKSKEDDTE